MTVEELESRILAPYKEGFFVCPYCGSRQGEVGEAKIGFWYDGSVRHAAIPHSCHNCQWYGDVNVYASLPLAAERFARN